MADENTVFCVAASPSTAGQDNRCTVDSGRGGALKRACESDQPASKRVRTHRSDTGTSSSLRPHEVVTNENKIVIHQIYKAEDNSMIIAYDENVNLLHLVKCAEEEKADESHENAEFYAPGSTSTTGQDNRCTVDSGRGGGLKRSCEGDQPASKRVSNGSVDDVICDVSTESAERVPSEDTYAGLIDVQNIKQEVIDDEYENVYNQYLSQWTTEITCPFIKQEVIDQEYHLSQQWDDRVPSASWEATYAELTDQRINEDYYSDDDDKYIQYLR